MLGRWIHCRLIYLPLLGLSYTICRPTYYNWGLLYTSASDTLIPGRWLADRISDIFQNRHLVAELGTKTHWIIHWKIHCWKLSNLCMIVGTYTETSYTYIGGYIRCIEHMSISGTWVYKWDLCIQGPTMDRCLIEVPVITGTRASPTYWPNVPA